MLFNSLEYAVFFPAVALAFFLLPQRARPPLLLAASCLFYAAYVPRYLLILFFLILVDYAAGRLMEGAPPARRRTVLVASLLANLATLGFFKYYGFAHENLSALGAWLGFGNPLPVLRIVLPIGLSFHTFQSMAYTIEVYWERWPAEKNLLRYALYVLFFPQLVAGPIERPQSLLPQLASPVRFDAGRAHSGLRLILFGLFKKCVIADRAAVLVNQVFDHHAQQGGATLLLAACAFGIQIYGDFSGYTDIARGSARILGYELTENFRWPYAAKTIQEFWRRWHITLFDWFRDYLLTPLVYGGERSVARVYQAVLFVFLVSGIWHGASWTFVAWGLLHGIYSVTGMATGPARKALAHASGLAARPRLHAALKTLVTYVLVTLSWVLFRAHSLSQAAEIYRRIFTAFRPADLLTADLGLDARGLLALWLCVALLELLQWLHRRGVRLFDLVAARPLPERWLFYYACVIGFYLMADVRPQQFIYFQF